jgi:ribosomal 50S subunit-recycling heat shock protein
VSCGPVPGSEGISDSGLGKMRLDVFLKRSRIIPRRTLAREVCDHGGIWVNGRQAKGSRLVSVGDLIQWRQPDKIMTLKVSRLPSENSGKRGARSLYEIVARERVSPGNWEVPGRTDSG